MSNKSLEIIKALKEFEWQTKVGWLGYTVGISTFSLASIIALQKIKIPLDLYWIIGIFIVPQVFHSLVWFIKRNFPYDSNVLTVAFAIKTEETSKNYYREIKKRFQEQIASYNLQNYLKIKVVPSDINFSEDSSAEKFIVKKGISLLVWGNTIEGNINNAPFTQFNIKFSYLHGVFDKDKQKKFVDDIRDVIQRESWEVWKPNSFHYLVIVSGNVIEISLFILGTCLATIPTINALLKSVDIFEKLGLRLKERMEDVNFPKLKLVKQKVRSFLCDEYTILLIYYWGNQKNIDKAVEFADKAIKIDENNFIAHQNMAMLKWLKGEKKVAKYHTQRAWRIRPGHPLPRFNKAFFYVYERKFELGLKQYKKIQYADDTNIVDVIEFIEREFEKTKDNLGLLFSTGWLNIKYADQVRGIAQLQDFLLKTNSNQEYNLLIVETQKILLTLSIK